MTAHIAIFDVEQNTPEWYLARAGVPTASCFKMVLAEGRKGERSKTRDGYLNQLADEVIYQDPVESYSNEDMERGKVMEAEARSIYALEHDVMPEQVGFIFNKKIRAGCSPDSLIDKNGILQIKTSYPRLWVQTMIKGEFPLEHKPQCQGELLVTEREWIDLMIYWPRRKPFIVRAFRDEPYLKNLENELRIFNDELESIALAMRTRLDLKGQLKASA